MRHAAILVVVSLIAAGVPAAASASRTVQADCVVPSPGRAAVDIGDVLPCPSGSGGASAGGVRFPVQAGGANASIELAEGSGRAVAVGAAGAVLEQIPFCRDVDVTLPDAARGLWVLPDGERCNGDPVAGPVSVRATFRPGAEPNRTEGRCGWLLPRSGPERRVCVRGGSGGTADVTRNASCPAPLPGVGVRVGDGSARVCTGLASDLGPEPPSFRVTPPSVDPGSPPDGDTFVAPCPGAVGGAVRVVGNGAEVCVGLAWGTGGADLNVDLSPCPAGVDPRVDVAGVFVQICLRAHTVTDRPELPSVDPGSVDPPAASELSPRVKTAGCPAGTDPSVAWLGTSVTLCVRHEVAPPSAGARSCGSGEGVVVEAAGAPAGVCVR